MKVIRVLRAIFGIFLLIVVHEVGHFAAARFCNVTVAEFQIGLFKVASMQCGHTEYSLGALLVLGFVRPLDENRYKSMQESSELESLPTETQKLYADSSHWLDQTTYSNKCIVALGGPAASIGFGVLLWGMILPALAYLRGSSLPADPLTRAENISRPLKSIHTSIVMATVFVLMVPYRMSKLLYYGIECKDVYNKDGIRTIEVKTTDSEGNEITEVVTVQRKVLGPHQLFGILAEPGLKVSSYLIALSSISIGIGALMLTPIPPLDGSHIWLAALQELWPANSVLGPWTKAHWNLYSFFLLLLLLCFCEATVIRPAWERYHRED